MAKNVVNMILDNIKNSEYLYKYLPWIWYNKRALNRINWTWSPTNISVKWICAIKDLWKIFTFTTYWMSSYVIEIKNLFTKLSWIIDSINIKTYQWCINW